MHFKLLYPSQYLAACDLTGKDVKVTIESIKVEDIHTEKGAEKKVIIRFSGKQKMMILNKTNAKTIAKRYGNDTDDWIGKVVTLYPTTCQAFGDTHECLRIR